MRVANFLLVFMDSATHVHVNIMYEAFGFIRDYSVSSII